MKRIRLPRSGATPVFWCLLIAVLMLLSGCSSMRAVETWRNPAKSAHRYHKLMIVGIGHDESVRAMVENILVEELRRGGVTAVASHNLVKEIDSAKRDDIVRVVRAVGADAVLTLKPIAKGDTNVTQGGESGGIYGTRGNVAGSYIPAAKTYTDAVIQTNLYDSATAELVWSATIDTYDAERPARVSRDLAVFFLEYLKRDGFL